MAVTTASSRFRTSPMLLLLLFACLSSLQLSAAAREPDTSSWNTAVLACADSIKPDSSVSALAPGGPQPVMNAIENLSLVTDDAAGFNCSECELGDADRCFNEDTDEPYGRLAAQDKSSMSSFTIFSGWPILDGQNRFVWIEVALAILPGIPGGTSHVSISASAFNSPECKGDAQPVPTVISEHQSWKFSNGGEFVRILYYMDDILVPDCGPAKYFEMSFIGYEGSEVQVISALPWMIGDVSGGAATSTSMLSVLAAVLAGAAVMCL